MPSGGVRPGFWRGATATGGAAADGQGRRATQPKRSVNELQQARRLREALKAARPVESAPVSRRCLRFALHYRPYSQCTHDTDVEAKLLSATLARRRPCWEVNVEIQGHQSDSSADPFSISLAVPLAQAYADMGLRQYNVLAETFGTNVQGATNVTLDGSAAIAAATVLALAAELLLKIANFQATGRYPKGHDLAALMRLLPADQTQFLNAAYDKYVTENERILSFRVQLLPPGTAAPSEVEENRVPMTLDDALSQAAPLFVKLRYLYEEVTQGFDSTIDFRCLLPLVNGLLGLVFAPRVGSRWTIATGEPSTQGQSMERGD